MTAGGPLRIALLEDSSGMAAALAVALRAAGHDAHVLARHGLRVLDAVLERRGFTGPLAHVPFALRDIVRGAYDVVHAFSPPDAAAALAARRPVVFTCTEVLDRSSVADRRLRLALLRRAVEDADAVVAATEDARVALRRWLAVDAPVLDADDARAHERLYRAITVAA